MKKVISIVIIFFMICLIYEFGVLLFVKHYKYEYVFTNNKKQYKIEEEYNYRDGNHTYDIKISDNKGNEYLYFITHNYHKEKEVLQDLIVFNKDKKHCIFPIFKDNVVSNIMCNDNKNKMSYIALTESDNEFANQIKNMLIEKKYNVPAFNYNEETKELTSLTTKLSYYKDFIPKYNILVWNYKGVFFVNKKESNVNDFLKTDVYDTKYITTSNNYMYVMDIENTMSSFDKIYAIDLKDGKSSIIDVMDKNISTNSYFNGVYNNSVYFTDCNGNKQYTFKEGKNTVSKIELQGMIKYYDGKNLVNESVDDISNNYVYFNKNVINDKITRLYGTSDIKLSNNHYYYKTENGKFYLTQKNNYKKPVLLFTKPEMDEWMVVNDTIFGIIGNTLYAYNSNYGFKPLIKYDEFNYHKNNMYGIRYIGD